VIGPLVRFAKQSGETQADFDFVPSSSFNSGVMQ
jgi:BCD family chlorophyll transporter-like MFS transporter